MLHFSPTNDPHTPKSPSSKIKHTRDDSSLDKSQTKLNTAQSCRRITTEQSPNIKKFHDKVVKKPTENKSSKNKNKNSQPKISKQSSSKNLKNIKLSNSVNKKIESYLNVFSPKTKNLQPHNLPKQQQNKDLVTTITQKSGLKKTTGAKANIIRVNKTTQDDKISAFIPYSDKDQQQRQRSPNNDNKKSMKKTNKSKLQKPLFKLSTQSKPTALKTLQNEPISILSNKHRNSNKADQPSISKKPSTNQRRPNTRQKPLYHNLKMKTQQSMLSYCQSTPSQIFTHDIDFLQLIGEGTFGKVYKGIIKKTSQIVAVKKVFQDKKYKNRQIEIISMVRNSNFVMKVMGTYMTYEDDKEYLNIVMRYYQGDLYKDIHGKVGLSNMEIKIYTYQILRGLLYLHSKKICHRDIKPHNILTNNMQVAICDFGSAKILHPLHQNLAYICSRCYRAPQLIFGATHYTTMIDIWSLGCVILEMIHGSPFFIGNSSIDQLIQIIKVLGTPTKSQVKEMNQGYDLKDYKFPNIKCKQLKELFPTTDPLLLDLLSQLMLYSPKQRLNAAQALVHQYFDQLRDQQTYITLRKDFNLCDFFDFTPQQMKQNEHLYGQLVPEWYTKGHFTYFENQEIERNNTLKFYVG